MPRHFRSQWFIEEKPGAGEPFKCYKNGPQCPETKMCFWWFVIGPWFHWMYIELQSGWGHGCFCWPPHVMVHWCNSMHQFSRCIWQFVNELAWHFGFDVQYVFESARSFRLWCSIGIARMPLVGIFVLICQGDCGVLYGHLLWLLVQYFVGLSLSCPVAWDWFDRVVGSSTYAMVHL